MLSTLICSGLLGGAAIGSPPGTTEPAWPRHSLALGQVWAVKLPDQEPFEASALLRMPDGSLLTLSDRQPEIFRIRLRPGAAEAVLHREESLFPEGALQPLKRLKPHRFDCEGLAMDPEGRLYLCDETDRWIVRHDPSTGTLERLQIDWGPSETRFSTRDRNASFEGIAVGGGRLYLANERDSGMILEVDPVAGSVVATLEPRSHANSILDSHYSDLCWFEGRLYVLLRESRCVLALDPATRNVLGEYDYAAIEDADEYRFRKRLPFTGVMEGLAVDGESFWLITDNNNLGRECDPEDRRPLLFRCPRPGVDKRTSPGAEMEETASEQNHGPRESSSRGP